MKSIKGYIKNSAIVTVVACGLFGCTTDLDVNENPNSPNFSTPALTLPVGQQNLLELNSTTMNNLGNFMACNWAKPARQNYFSDLLEYNITSDFYKSVFSSSYTDVLNNLTYVENFETDDNLNYDAFKIIARILKAYQFQYLVDLYGDVPYSEANLRNELLTPKYDKAEDIYEGLIKELTEAAALAANMPADFENPGSQDIIFSGDMMKWAQFANTVKLRMLIRLSNKKSLGEIKTEISKIDVNNAGYIGEENVKGQPGYSNDSDKQNPFFGYIGKTTSGEVKFRHEITVASEYAVGLLELSKDARIRKLFTPLDSTENVLAIASTPTSPARNLIWYNDFKYKGAPQQMNFIVSDMLKGDLSHVGKGLLKDSEQDQPLMLLSESKFLQAEAVVRGFITGGKSAEELYNEGITASYVHLGVRNDFDPSPSTAVINDIQLAESAALKYYSQTGLSNVNYNDATDKIEAIITQKWIALSGTSGIESWIELTRTGFPKNIPLPEGTTVRPVRLLYPSTEISRNVKNVPVQPSSDAFDKYPFWK